MSRINEPWDDDEDLKLVSWGCCIGDGHAFVAEHDFGRSEQEGRDRYEFLKKERPQWVAEIERKAKS
ncbi:MAG: hypothetical protein P4L10_11105 [Acidobacteriaceae bacterium]|nr:hypothetical protein [Acidobacteriaceae bacterium]